MLTPFSSVLIANRGEIALRVIRSARAAGLRTIAVYTEADAGAPHVAAADAALCIGAGPVGESYLDPQVILDAAAQSGAEAIHPGYGFLSESAAFARAVSAAGLVFIGPPAEAIAAMADKSEAKRLMIDAGVPCVPGYEGDDQSDAALIDAAQRVGFPIMVKASAGGGGRGMRHVAQPGDLPEALARARAEALGAFGSDHLILERAIAPARHIEIQIFADAHGTCLHLGERDCSVQRRHQKVIEESPSPAMTEDLRARMGAAAVAAAQAVAYRGAGTVEFLLDDAGAFYFLEMNTRLQVEHPVTEAVTGLDLVDLQLRVAQGAPLGLAQSDIVLRGHAIEARLYAEDPAQGFLPSTGRVSGWHPAPGLRCDAGICDGQEIAPFYDPMLAKLIAHGATRAEALRRLRAGIERTVLLGPASNLGFLDAILASAPFAAGDATTSLIDDHWPEGVPAPVPAPEEIATAAALILAAEYAQVRALSGLCEDTLIGLGALDHPVSLRQGDRLYELRAQYQSDGWMIRDPESGWAHHIRLCADRPDRVVIDAGRRPLRAARARGGVDLAVGGQSLHFAPVRPGAAAPDAASTGRIVAPMPGQVVSVRVAPGDTVAAGEILAVVEAMKMQHQMRAPVAGQVDQIHVAPGDQLSAGAAVITLDVEAS